MIASEHEGLSNQELIDIYGPQVTNWKKPKGGSVSYSVEPANHEAIYQLRFNPEKNMIDRKIKIPNEARDLIYRLSSKKEKKKLNKAIAKQKREGKIKFKLRAITSSKRVLKQRLKNVGKMRSLQSGNFNNS
jgi:hypothetical protein